MKNSISTLTAVLAFGFAGTGSALIAQSDEAERARNLVQMPVAVAKASEAGVPDHAMQRLGSALNRGRVDPADFNDTVRNAPLLADDVGGVTGVGDFVTGQVESGLRGRDLADSIHARLREAGIPAGGHDGSGPPPIARNFIPPEALEAIERNRPLDERAAQERSRRPAIGERPERPSPASRPDIGRPETGRPSMGAPSGGSPAGGARPAMGGGGGAPGGGPRGR